MDLIDVLISIGDLLSLENLYRARAGFGREFAFYIDSAISNNLSSLASLNGIKGEFNSFRELMKEYDFVYSPLHDLPSSQGWIIVAKNEPLPYSLDEFLRLLIRSDYRGLRVIPGVDIKKGVDIKLYDKPYEDDENSLDSTFIIRRTTKTNFDLLVLDCEHEIRDQLYNEVVVYNPGKYVGIPSTISRYKQDLIYQIIQLKKLFSATNYSTVLVSQHYDHLAFIREVIDKREAKMMVPVIGEQGFYDDFIYLSVDARGDGVFVECRCDRIRSRYKSGYDNIDLDIDLGFYDTLDDRYKEAYISYLIQDSQLAKVINSKLILNDNTYLVVFKDPVQGWVFAYFPITQ